MNKYIIGGAGSGKTTFFVKEALKIQDENVLITTYTEANEEEIRRKFILLNGGVPKNVTIKAWFSFLFQHWVRPFQGSYNSALFKYDIKGMLLVNKASGIRYTDKRTRVPVPYGERENFFEHYFTKDHKIYSDKIAKFADSANRVSCNKVINRLEKIFQHIFIDEVQDLAGYDLDLIKVMMKSAINVLLVGDPRQVTYVTHQPKRHKKYLEGNIKAFLVEECKSLIKDNIDETSLSYSHRNNLQICNYSAKLYPHIKKLNPCECCRSEVEHQGVFFVRKSDIEQYISEFSPIQLKWDIRTEVSPSALKINFGESKGLTYNRVLIYPTKPMVDWIKNNDFALKQESRAKLYVGITRAKYSVAIVFDYDENNDYDPVVKYKART